MNAYQVVVNVSVNSSGVTGGVNAYSAGMSAISQAARLTATQSAASFDSIFGANFFADLAAQAVRSMATAFTSIVQQATKAAIEAESAFKGLGSVAKNLGVDERATVSALKNLDLVRNGLLNLSDGALALKNLLATGFSLDEATTLIKVFGDAAAFGRQAALTFGYAISSATQGIKNQNSILVDNAGITKNISVILAEQGFVIQDLSDKYKGVAARQALYTGLLKEGALFQGNANDLLQTAQGRMLQLDAAQQRLFISLGKVVTESKALGVVLSGLVAIFDLIAQQPEILIAVASAFGILTAAIIAMNSATIASLPVISQAISSFVLLGKVMTGTASLAAGQAATLAVATAGWLALGLAVGAAVAALAYYVRESQRLKPLTDEQIKSALARKSAAEDEATFVKSLSTDVALNAREQQKLVQAYQSLDGPAKARLQLIKDETERTRELIAEKERLARQQGFAVDTEGIRRIEELSNALSKQNDLTKEAAAIQERYDNASVLALNGREEGIAAREKAIRATAEADILLNTKNQVDNTLAIQDAAKALIEYSKITGKSTDDVIKMAVESGRLTVSQDDLRAAIKAVKDAQDQTAQSTDGLTNSYIKLRDELESLENVLDRSPARRKILDKLTNVLAEENILGRGNAAAELRKRIASDPELANLLKSEQDFQKNKKALDEIINPRQTRRQKSEYERLRDDVARLNAEVKSFTDLSSREFQLRFEREGLERTRRDFEKILDLRRELSLPLTDPLPTDPSQLEAEIRRLENLKAIKEGVQKAAEETVVAERDLAIARQSLAIPVVDAQTRANIAYARSLRDIQNSDQQLTADVIVASRQREDRMKDETRNTFRAYQGLRLDLLKETAELNKELEKNKLLLRIIEGDESSIQTEINDIVNVNLPKNELTVVAENTTAIKALLNKWDNQPPPTQNPTTPENQVPLFNNTPGMPAWMRKLPRNNAQTRNLPTLQVPGSGDVTLVPVPSGEVPIEGGTTNAAGVRVDELRRERMKIVATKAVVDSAIEANTRIEQNEAALSAGLISFDLEVRAARSDTQIARLRDTRATAVNIKLIEDDLTKLEADDIEYLSRLRQKSKEQRLAELRALKEATLATRDEIAALRRGDPEFARLERARQDSDTADAELNRVREISRLQRELFSTDALDVANRATSEADRYQLAWLNALKNVREADIEARESMIESQVKIADAQIFHADQANAKVLDFLAQQKSMTDIIADAKIGVISATYNFIDSGLSKITAKLGIAGDLVRDLLSSMIKLVLNNAFRALFGLNGTGGSAGSSVSGGGFNPLGALSSIFTGGGQSGSFSTPGFNPNIGSFANRGGAINFGSILNNPSSLRQFANFGGPTIDATSVSAIAGPHSAAGVGAGVGGQVSQAGGGVLSSIFGPGFNLKSLGSAVGSIAPLLGGSLGASVGGSSVTGQILGSAGGILAGGVLSALIGGSLTGATTGGIFGSIGGLLGISAGATAGIALAIAPLLLLGGWLLGRNKLRRQEEKQRTEILLSSKDQLKKILAGVRSGRLDSATAIAQADAVRADYMQKVSQLKDSKTRRIAQQTVRELDAIISEIRAAGRQADIAAENFKLLIPTFATGGNISFVSKTQGMSGESIFIAKRDDEVVLTNQHVANLGGAGALARAGVPGYTGIPQPSVPLSSLSQRSVSFDGGPTRGDGAKQNLFVIVADDDAADRIVGRARPGTVAHKMRLHTRQTGLDGYAGDVLDAQFR